MNNKSSPRKLFLQYIYIYTVHISWEYERLTKERELVLPRVPREVLCALERSSKNKGQTLFLIN